MLPSEVARLGGCSAERLRYYESAGLLRPKRRGAGACRDYESADVARVVLIRNPRGLGLSLKAIRDLPQLADDRALPYEQIERVARAHLADVRTKIAQLEQMAAALERATRSCLDGPVARCRILASLTQLPHADSSLRARTATCR